MGRQLRDRDVAGLLDDVQGLGRRAPGAFFAGSVVAGFLMARFLKSSSERGTSTGTATDSGTGTGTDRGADLRGRSADPLGAVVSSGGMASSSGPGVPGSVGGSTVPGATGEHHGH